MLYITRLMDELARDRPVFHSEADLQHALGMCRIWAPEDR